jgi:hypothetical protein
MELMIYNPFTPSHILEKIANLYSSNFSVLADVVKHPNTSASTIVKIATDNRNTSFYELKIAIAENPNQGERIKTGFISIESY